MDKPFLFVGLDYEQPEEVVDFAQDLDRIKRYNFGFKLNLDFVVNAGLTGDHQFMKDILELKRPLFVDLKMWNGRRTMSSIIKTLGKLGVNYTNVYSLADKPFLAATVRATQGTNTRILGVTVLTHYDEAYCQSMRGCSLKEAVRKDAEVAYNSGCHGIILPGTMLGEVKDLEIKKLVPAVRPKWYGKTGDNWQKQEVSVREAIEGGADFLVCSSPIRKSENRKEALEKTLDEMD